MLHMYIYIYIQYIIASISARTRTFIILCNRHSDGKAMSRPSTCCEPSCDSRTSPMATTRSRCAYAPLTRWLWRVLWVASQLW